ncbi:hypothetical protein BSKO_09172 [Bryopsis sp. KO-2023]|nr:hypothetical protein BSKO_09172 [Bryopsis sp. KO-2023]
MAASSSIRPYLQSIRETLNKAVCVRTFPCQDVERHNKPEVEYQTSKELLLEPVCISRNAHEKILIEQSINSLRVSIKVKRCDALETVLCHMYVRFLMQRAESFQVLRRVPVDGFDISFLITDAHCLVMRRTKLVDFICQFVEDLDAEINRMKLAVNTRGRAVATSFLRGLSN